MNLTMAPLGLFFALIVYVIGAVIFYWIIRLAVRHGMRDHEVWKRGQ